MNNTNKSEPRGVVKGVVEWSPEKIELTPEGKTIRIQGHFFGPKVVTVIIPGMN